MKWKQAAAAAIAGIMLFSAMGAAAGAAAADRTSKYRVYQNNNALMEFSNRNQAIAYGKQFSNAYVEQIGTRAWVWDNFPVYKVYQRNASKREWEFHTLEAAVAEAKKWANASVRKLSDGGWVWDNYAKHPGYRVYQGEKTLPNWTFSTLEGAKAEAKKWANAFVIDLSTSKWVWDNIPARQKEEFRNRAITYQVYQGNKTLDTWGFAYLQDAINETVKWANSRVVKITTDNVVFENRHPYVVMQDGARKASFAALGAAVQYASNTERASIVWDGKPIWTNVPYYAVFQTGDYLRSFPTPSEAAAYGATLQNAEVITSDGLRIWDNLKKLLYLGWNGTSNHNTIVTHVTQTQGLDIDSPTWFYLEDASGKLNDESNPKTMEWLNTQGVELHPLVHNQFDTEMTSAFLANPEAQRHFIETLMNRLVEMKADGVNLDFESLAGADRSRFTDFVKAFAAAARAKGLTVSIDLPRGSASWNHLTAFDHAEIAKHVDYIAIMAYDQFYRGSKTPGPVAGLDWTEQGVQEFLSYGVPRSKLLLGVPFYIRVWEVDASGTLLSNRAIWMKDLDAALQGASEVTVTPDSRYGLDKVEYVKDGKRYVLWQETNETIRQRVELAKEYDLAGIAAWRLGYEPASLWTQLLRMK